MAQIKKITEVTCPFFEKNIQNWIFDGFTFIAESKKKFALYQIFITFGGLTSYPRVEADWFLFVIKDDFFLEMLTYNGVKYDLDTIKIHGESDGLSAKEIKIILQYVEDKKLSEEDAKKIVEEKLEPIIKEKVFALRNSMAKVNKLTEEEMVDLMRLIENLQVELEAFYPRSYYKLKIMKTELRKSYAKLKHPDLYFELEKLSHDPKYKIDLNDLIIGFGPRVALRRIFYEYFDANLFDENWNLSSPFENKLSRFI